MERDDKDIDTDIIVNKFHFKHLFIMDQVFNQHIKCLLPILFLDRTFITETAAKDIYFII